MTPQGWDRADFSCRCGHSFTSTTEAEFLHARKVHAAAHDLVWCMLASPDIHGQVLALLASPPASLVHECRDCPKHGGIGFDCHHLVRGVRVADSCDWCREGGLTPGQVIPGQEATRKT